MSTFSLVKTGSGWSAAEPQWRWAVGKKAEIYFSGVKAGSKRIRARFTASSLRQLGKSVRCTITLNGIVIFNARITPGWKDYEFSFDAGLLTAPNKMTLAFDKAMAIPTDSRELSVCFKQFRFSPETVAAPAWTAPFRTDPKALGNLVRPRALQRLLSRF